MKQITTFLIVAISFVGIACKRSESASSTPRRTARKDYDANRDKTTISSPDIVKQLADRKITISASYTYGGTAPSGPAELVDLFITSQPTGRGVDGDTVPASVTADGKNLTKDRVFSTSAENGKRLYLIDITRPQFDLVTHAQSVVVEVNDVKLNLDHADIDLLGTIFSSGLR
jgi:hypothetical protein